MNRAAVDRIAQAILYEGYILYPYRPSSSKNRYRWNFGVLYPEAWSAAQTGSDRSYFEMQCLALADESASLDVMVRFLHLTGTSEREQTWQIASERTVEEQGLSLGAISQQPWRKAFSFPGSPGANSRSVPVEGNIEIAALSLGTGVFRIGVIVRNATSLAESGRDEALLRSLASAHAVLGITGGGFVSMTDPPDTLREAVDACNNVGVWPVLAGEAGARDVMLGSPIILGDYPQVAPESAGDLFDATEIDEILTLRVLTLSDEEKAEIRSSDDRGRRLLERAEALSFEQLMQLHGVVRELRPAASTPAEPWSAWDTSDRPVVETVRVSGIELRKGDRVRLRPSRRADVMDLIFDGKMAVIEAIEQDLEDKIHLSVVLEDDPGRDLGELRQSGHRFFFSPEEVEPAGPAQMQTQPAHTLGGVLNESS
jgi:hypothetical protein